jgi:hypothetical protein
LVIFLFARQNLPGLRKRLAKGSSFVRFPLAFAMGKCLTLTNAQTVWHDLAEFAGRDSASMKSPALLGRQTLLVRAASC